jgi:hypothetical protein
MRAAVSSATPFLRYAVTPVARMFVMSADRALPDIWGVAGI